MRCPNSGYMFFCVSNFEASQLTWPLQYDVWAVGLVRDHVNFVHTVYHINCLSFSHNFWGALWGLRLGEKASYVSFIDTKDYICSISPAKEITWRRACHFDQGDMLFMKQATLWTRYAPGSEIFVPSHHQVNSVPLSRASHIRFMI